MCTQHHASCTSGTSSRNRAFASFVEHRLVFRRLANSMISPCVVLPDSQVHVAYALATFCGSDRCHCAAITKWINFVEETDKLVDQSCLVFPPCPRKHQSAPAHTKRWCSPSRTTAHHSLAKTLAIPLSSCVNSRSRTTSFRFPALRRDTLVRVHFRVTSRLLLIDGHR